MIVSTRARNRQAMSLKRGRCRLRRLNKNPRIDPRTRNGRRNIRIKKNPKKRSYSPRNPQKTRKKKNLKKTKTITNLITDI